MRHMTYALEINQLHKAYDNGFEALKGISLKVAQGDFFALLGPCLLYTSDAADE